MDDHGTKAEIAARPERAHEPRHRAGAHANPHPCHVGRVPYMWHAIRSPAPHTTGVDPC